MWICAGRPPYGVGRGPSNRNRPAALVLTEPRPAGVYTPLVFDCQNDTIAPRTGLHVGARTMPVNTWPVPILSRNGAVPRSGPPPSFSVGVHGAWGAAPTDAAARAAITPTTHMAPSRRIART